MEQILEQTLDQTVDAAMADDQFSAQKSRISPTSLLDEARDLVNSVGRLDRKLRAHNAKLVVVGVKIYDFYLDYDDANIDRDIGAAGITVKPGDKGVSELVRKCIKLMVHGCEPNDTPKPATLTRLGRAVEWAVDWRVRERVKRDKDGIDADVTYGDLVKAVEDKGYYNVANIRAGAGKARRAVDPSVLDRMRVPGDTCGRDEEPDVLDGTNLDDEDVGPIADDEPSQTITMTMERPAQRILVEVESDGTYTVMALDRRTAIVKASDGRFIRLKLNQAQVDAMIDMHGGRS